MGAWFPFRFTKLLPSGEAEIGETFFRRILVRPVGDSRETMPESEKGIRWWMRYVIVPLLSGGGIVAILFAAFLSSRSNNTPDRAQSIVGRIRLAEPFQVKFYKTIGDLGAGQTYYAWYTPTERKMSVTGFAATVQKPNTTGSYPCPDVDRGKINLWGHSFYVEGDEIVDADTNEGRCGKICFDGECK
jgi:hypothetical protein